LANSIDAQRFACGAHHVLVAQGFVQITFPLFLQVVVERTGERGAVHLFAAQFGLHHLQQQILELRFVVS